MPTFIGGIKNHKFYNIYSTPVPWLAPKHLSMITTWRWNLSRILVRRREYPRYVECIGIGVVEDRAAQSAAVKILGRDDGGCHVIDFILGPLVWYWPVPVAVKRIDFLDSIRVDSFAQSSLSTLPAQGDAESVETVGVL